MAVHSSSVVRSNNKGRGAPRPADNSSAHQRGRLTSVYDAQYTTVTYVPTHLITHTPPARLNITRLVFCRNYRPCEAGSCAMGDGCKFVHADVELESLESHPIHVKYSWRSEELCIYPRLPGGRLLRVTAPNNRPPVEEIPSERVLLTRGALNEDGCAGPLSHCAHYYFNRMCNRGERCNFIHAVHVDPNVVGDFKRAPARCVVSCPRPQRLSKRSSSSAAAAAPPSDVPQMLTPEELTKMYGGLQLEEVCLAEPKALGAVVNFAPLMIYPSADASSSRKESVNAYRRNPYSLRVVTVSVTDEWEARE